MIPVLLVDILVPLHLLVFVLVMVRVIALAIWAPTEMPFWRGLRFVITSTVIAFFWPLALFSKRGRASIFQKLTWGESKP